MPRGSHCVDLDIWIGGHKCRLHSGDLSGDGGDDEDVAGKWVGKTRTIVIDIGWHDDLQQTMWHEVTHAWLHFTGLGLADQVDVEVACDAGHSARASVEQDPRNREVLLWVEAQAKECNDSACSDETP